MDDWRTELTVTCPGFPLQIEGKIEGTYVYYRERWGGWSVGFGKTADESLTSNDFGGGVQEGTHDQLEAFQRIIDTYRQWKALM